MQRRPSFQPAGYATGGETLDAALCLRLFVADAFPIVDHSLPIVAADQQAAAPAGNAALFPLALPSVAVPSPLQVVPSKLQFSLSLIPHQSPFPYPGLVFPCLVPVFPSLAPTLAP